MSPYGMGDAHHIKKVLVVVATVVDNSGKVWGTSNVIKANNDVSDPPLRVFQWSYIRFFKFRLARKTENQTKIGTLI